MAIKLPKGFFSFTGFDISRIDNKNNIKGIWDIKVILRELFDDLQKLSAYLNAESGGIEGEIISNHSELEELDYASAEHTGFEPTVTKGNLTGVSPITVSGGTGAVIGSGAEISFSVISSPVHLAYCATAAGPFNTISAYLDVDETGELITVNCLIDNMQTHLDEAKPRLLQHMPIIVVKICEEPCETWYCLWGFIDSCLANVTCI
jgi:hypothetical protein